MANEVDSMSEKRREEIYEAIVTEISGRLVEVLGTHNKSERLARAIAFCIESAVRAYMSEHELVYHPYRD